MGFFDAIENAVKEGVEDVFVKPAEAVAEEVETVVDEVKDVYDNGFYPDNVKRRQRVEQLQADLKAFTDEGSDHNEAHDSRFQALQPKIAALLQRHGFETIDDAYSALEGTLSPDELATYQSVKNSEALSNNIHGGIKDVFTCGSAVVGVGLGVAVALTAVTGGAALDVIAIVGVVGLVTGLIDEIRVIVEESEQRDRLRSEIHNMAFQRVTAKMALEQLNVITQYIPTLEAFLEVGYFEANPDKLDAALQHTKFVADMSAITRGSVIQELETRDNTAGAWKDEDPDVTNPE